MPKSRLAKDALVTTKRHADDLPRKDDIFAEGFTWAEFIAFDTPRNSSQAKVDLSKERQMMYYLGKTSTEAKAQYTADWTKPVYDVRCNYLETIPKPAPTPRTSLPATYPRPQGRQINPTKPAPSRPVSYKPILPPSYSQPPPSSIKSDKPYVYKPKAELYYKDKQLNDPQLPYSQQPTQQYRQSDQYPYRTDGASPIWRPVDNQSPNPYATLTQQRVSPAQNHYNGSSIPNPLHHSNNNQLPVSQPLSRTTPANPAYNDQSLQKPAKSHTQRSSNSNTFKFNDIFQKYPYLQKQHNKAPGTYRSPYRQDTLGFCNGWEGDFKKYMEAQMLKDPTILSQHLMQVNNQSSSHDRNTSETPKKSYPAILPPSKGQYSSPAASYYPNGVPSTAQKQQQMLQPHITKPTATPWEKKETKLHPAIRQDYGAGGGMFHTNYQPVHNPSPQQRRESPILPPGYSKAQPQPQHQAIPRCVQPNRQSQQQQQQVHSVPTSQQQTTSSHASPAAQYYSRPQSRPQPSPFSHPALNNHVIPTTYAQNTPSPQNFSQNYSAPVRSFYSDTYHATGTSTAKAFMPTATDTGAIKSTPTQNAPLCSQPQLAANTPGGLDSSSVAIVSAGAGTDTVNRTEKKPDAYISDIDTDSTGMMETLMRNFQRAARQGQS